MKTINRQYAKDLLEKQILQDFLDGDSTVLAEIISGLTDDEIFNSLSDFNQEKLTIKEDEIPFTYSFLQIKIGWEKFCELTGTNEWAKNEGAEFKDNDIYYITESKAKKYNLL